MDSETELSSAGPCWGTEQQKRVFILQIPAWVSKKWLLRCNSSLLKNSSTKPSQSQDSQRLREGL